MPSCLFRRLQCRAKPGKSVWNQMINYLKCWQRYSMPTNGGPGCASHLVQMHQSGEDVPPASDCRGSVADPVATSERTSRCKDGYLARTLARASATSGCWAASDTSSWQHENTHAHAHAHGHTHATRKLITLLKTTTENDVVYHWYFFKDIYLVHIV